MGGGGGHVTKFVSRGGGLYMYRPEAGIETDGSNRLNCTAVIYYGHINLLITSL